MADPISLTTAIDNASKVANTPLFTTIIDKITGFKISQWAAEGELRKKLIHDEYEKAKENGIMGVQFIENLRRTTNLIDTAVKSSQYIDQEKSNEIKLDNDFFWNTLEHAKTVSNETMQELVAKIIAGEYNRPGSYSMSTLQTLKMLDKTELELFERMCSLCIGKGIPKVVFHLPYDNKQFITESNIGFGSFQELQALGLFLPNDMVSHHQNPDKKHFALYYFKKEILFKSTNENNTEIRLPGYYQLSNTGKQILDLLNPQFNEPYFNWLKANYKIPNYAVNED
jgi:hypothetical protein